MQGNNNMRTPYRPPTNIDRAQVTNLMPEHAMGAVLLPTTPVTIINRGPKTLDDKFDGHDYQLAPFGMFEVSYAAALHLQRRLIVPGTKTMDPGVPSYVSYIGIFGIDHADACTPFTEAQLTALGEPAEAFYRDPNDPLQQGFKTVSVKGEAARMPGHGLVPPAQAMDAQYGGIGLQQEVTGGPEVTDDIRAAATAPVASASDAVSEEASARNSGYENPDVTELRVRSVEPHKFKSSEPPASAGGAPEPVGAAAGAPKAPAIGKKKR